MAWITQTIGSNQAATSLQGVAQQAFGIAAQFKRGPAAAFCIGQAEVQRIFGKLGGTALGDLTVDYAEKGGVSRFCIARIVPSDAEKGSSRLLDYNRAATLMVLRRDNGLSDDITVGTEQAYTTSTVTTGNAAGTITTAKREVGVAKMVFSVGQTVEASDGTNVAVFVVRVVDKDNMLIQFSTPVMVSGATVAVGARLSTSSTCLLNTVSDEDLVSGATTLKLRTVSGVGKGAIVCVQDPTDLELDPVALYVTGVQGQTITFVLSGGGAYAGTTIASGARVTSVEFGLIFHEPGFSDEKWPGLSLADAYAGKYVSDVLGGTADLTPDAVEITTFKTGQSLASGGTSVELTSGNGITAGKSYQFIGPNAAATAAVDTASQAGPYNMANDDTLVLTTDTDNATVTFRTKAAASVLGASAAFGNFTGTTGLSFTVNGGTAQTMNLTAAVLTVDEIVTLINAAGITGVFAAKVGIEVKVTTDQKGAGSSLSISGTAYTKAFGASPVVTAGVGNVVDIDAVTASEVQTLAHAAFNALAADGATVTLPGLYPVITRNASGTTATMTLTGNARAIIGFTAGAQAGTDASSAIIVHIKRKNGAVVYFDDVGTITTLDDTTSVRLTAVDVVPAKGNASRYAVLLEANASGAGPSATSAATPWFCLPRPVKGIALTGGLDGTAISDADDIIGVNTEGAETGLYAMARIPEFREVAAIVSPLLSTNKTEKIDLASKASAWCDARAKKYLNVMPSSVTTYEGAKQYALQDEALDCKNLLSYFIWTYVDNPDVAGDVVAIPADGLILGVHARRAKIGPHIPPAGEILIGARGIVNPVDNDLAQDLEESCGVNTARIEGNAVILSTSRTSYRSKNSEDYPLCDANVVGWLNYKTQSYAEDLPSLLQSLGGEGFADLLGSRVRRFVSKEFMRGVFFPKAEGSAYRIVTDDTVNPIEKTSKGKFALVEKFWFAPTVRAIEVTTIVTASGISTQEA